MSSDLHSENSTNPAVCCLRQGSLSVSVRVRGARCGTEVRGVSSAGVQEGEVMQQMTARVS